MKKKYTFMMILACVIACITSCSNNKSNKQAQSTGDTDSTATKDTIVAEKVEPQVDSTKIFSDTVAQREKMTYKVTSQVEDDIVYDDERDLDKSTYTVSLRITFKSNGKVSIKEDIQDEGSWSGEWESNGYDVTIYTKEFTLKGTISEDYKTFKLSSESISKLSWDGSRKLKLQ